MRTYKTFRWTALVAILATLATVPASAQFGSFIKKKLKEKITQAVIEGVVPADTPATGAAGAQPGTPGRAVKGAPVAPPAGPVFDESVLEMTAAVLDNFEKGLVAEIAEQKTAAPQLARILDFGDYNKCINQLKATPEGQKAYQAKDNAQYQLERERATANLEKLEEASCGPSPGVSYKLRQQLAGQQAKAIEDASGLTQRQYNIIKERVIPFCASGPSAGGGAFHIPQGGVFLVYGTQEVMALGARCAKLSLSLKDAI